MIHLGDAVYMKFSISDTLMFKWWPVKQSSPLHFHHCSVHHLGYITVGKPIQ